MAVLGERVVVLMNDPKLARERLEAVKRAKKEGVPREKVWSRIQHDWNGGFEGHALKKTIKRVYDDGS